MDQRAKPEVERPRTDADGFTHGSPAGRYGGSVSGTRDEDVAPRGNG